MTDTKAADVDDYIARAHEDARPHLRAIRAAVRAAVPEAEEGLHWNKPYYRLHGMLAGFDAMKHHVSVEIWTDKLAAADRAALEDAGYKTGQRSFQVKFAQAVPVAILKRLVKAQAKANESKGKDE